MDGSLDTIGTSTSNSCSLLACRTRPHESTCKSPFFLLYGRDARLPTESTLEAPPSLYREDTETYGEELAEGLARAWNMKGVESCKLR